MPTQLQTRPVRSSGVSIPDTLNRYLSANSRDDLAGTTQYVDGGAELVTHTAINALRKLRPALQAKIDALDESEHLRRNLDVLATTFDEACIDGQMGTRMHREVTFALLYFLKGFDRIPDTVPELGLVDDAMIVELVLQRHSTALRAHWLRRRRAWPLAA